MASSKSTSKTCLIFQDSFSILTDPGRSNKGNYTYPLNEILFLTIAGVISGMDNQTAINNFAKIKLDWLRLYFPFESGIPSHDVLGDVFGKINPDKFSECFTHWINTLYEITKGEVVAIDGKTIRKSNDKVMVNALFMWSPLMQQCLSWSTMWMINIVPNCRLFKSDFPRGTPIFIQRSKFGFTSSNR